uniref:HORMA domain-containing protein 1-like n=1 Tax=Saccoglossus kowalevskii TaxID=10224 RepID=A0ABM0GJL0_SACKO|nr:PREDICTED: HORMA domain-containing protein 1-like [Saccoglossus kowalevskii]
MSLTSTAVRPGVKGKTGNWSSVFPQGQLTEQQSALFVKKLLAVALSNITYLRAIFPEHAFGDRCLEDLNLKILRDDSACPGACQLIKWVKGCFEALDKKYIYVDPDDPETLIESYTFKFHYQNNGGISIYRNENKISSAYSDSETKKATVRLLRTIIVLTQTLASLPDDVFMTMKLLYYDDVTPEDYEPQGFKPSDSDKFKYEFEPMNIKVGDVETNDDATEVVEEETSEYDNAMMTTVGLDEGKDNEDEPMQENYDNQSLSMNSHQHKSNSQEEPIPCPDVPCESPAKPGINEVASTPASQTSNLEESQEEYKVRCPCGCNEEDGLMVKCEGCKFWQHAICFGMTDENEVPDVHNCDVCADSNDVFRRPTDFILYGMNSVNVQAMCLWRRSLLACTEFKRLIAPNFSRRLGVEMNVAQGLINRLQKEGFVRAPAKGKRLGKIVNIDKVTEVGLQRYCKRSTTPEESNNSPVNPSQSKPKQANKSQPMDSQEKLSKKDEIEQLTSKTSRMDMSGKSLGKRSKRVKDIQQEQPRQSPRFQKRRFDERETKIVSRTDQSVYEISSSQDPDDSMMSTGRKKHKASIAGKSVMV